MLKKIINKASLITVALFHLMLSGCIGGYISVHTDYLSEESLASYYINTPDPRRQCPSVGQRLIISWSVPKKIFCYEDLHLKISMRYRNRETDEQTLALTQKSGTHIISSLNEHYYRTGGILTYKIELIGNDQVLEEWVHQIWATIIELKPVEPPQEPSDISDWDLENTL